MRMMSTWAAFWMNYGERNCWQWLSGDEDGQDIVAYFPDHGVRLERESPSV